MVFWQNTSPSRMFIWGMAIFSVVVRRWAPCFLSWVHISVLLTVCRHPGQWDMDVNCWQCSSTTTFSQIHAAFMISEVLSVSLPAALMTYSPWIHYLRSTAIMLCGFLMTTVITPDTFNGTKTAQAVDEDGIATEETPLSVESQQSLSKASWNDSVAL